ncbi:MAG: PEP-CTERM sorting domain-containing protein [Thermoguttaceae bacterium]|nr:PEP-CTERM sorting domain-containing protein [Thermoguttaceae bacterium]
MKTNTNTLRRALETFAKTGKITLTASALMALALTAPVNAAEKNFSESVIIEESTTVPAGDTYNYAVPEADAYNPIPGDLLEEPNSGLILNNGTLTIAGTANLTANFSSGSAVGDVSNLVIEDGGIFNVSRYSHMARHKDSVSNLTIEAGGTMNQTKSFYFGCRGESTADIYGTLNITDGNFHIGANYAYADETFRKNAVGIVTVHEGGVVTLTGSGRHISLGRFGSVNTTDKNVGILNIDGGTVTAPSISCADDSGLADKYTNTDYSHAEVNITNGGTLNVGSVTMPYGTGWIVVDGAGSALNVSDTINMYWKDLEVRNGGTVNATKVVSGGYAETAFILDGGTANISGTFTNNGKTANGGGLIIKNGGLLNLTGSNTIDGSGEIVISSGEIKTSDNTLALSGKTLNYSGGTLPETLNLTKTALNISNTADWNVKNVNDTNGSTLSVAFTPDGTGILLGNTTFAGFETADVTLKFAEGVNNQRLTSYAMTGGKITYETAAAKNLVQYRNGAYLAEGDTFSDLSIRSGDVIELTADISVSQPASLSGSSSLTIQSDSDNIKRTISGNDTGRILTGIADGELKLSNLRFTNGFGSGSSGSDYGGVLKCAYGSVGNTITIIGDNVSFENSYAKGRGGALYGYNQNFDIRGASFINNKSSWGGALYTAEGYVKLQDTLFEGNIGTDRGAAIYSAATQDVTLSGKNVFRNNYAGAFGAGIWASDARVILEGENLFEGNHVGDYGSNNAKGAAIMSKGVTLSGNNTFLNNYTHSNGGQDSGGAIYSQGGDVVFKGDGSTATFEGNAMGGVPNDIMLHGWADYGNGYKYRDIAVTIQDKGTYYFGGGIAEETAQSTTALNIKDGANVTFGGQSISNIDTMDITNGADVTFQSGAKLTVNNGATVNNATLNLEGDVDFSGKLTMTNTTANFNAGPTVNGFTTLNADQFSGTVNVDLNVFTVGAMDNTTNTLTFIDGAKAENVNITNGNLMTNANVDGKTAVTINQDKDGTTYGSAPVQGSELVGIDFEKGQTSMTVKDFSLIVDGKDIDLNAFAEWLGDETGLETSVGTGYVSVRLESPFEIMADDSFIWDFSGFQNGIANLQFASVNMMDSTVPEPTTWALLVLGGLGIFGVARKNRKAKK